MKSYYKFWIFLLLVSIYITNVVEPLQAGGKPVKSEYVQLFKRGIEQVGEYSINAKQVYGRNDISAVSCTRQGYCFIGSDEGVYAQLCKISKDDEIIITGIVRLLEEESDSEINIEGATAIDLLPTLARLSGNSAPKDRIIDGKDIWPLMSGMPGARSPHEAFYYYQTDQL